MIDDANRGDPSPPRPSAASSAPEPAARIDELLEQLTDDERVALVAGEDLWHVPAVARLGIPRLKVTDGPAGARGESFTGTRSASFPCGTALAATWDVDLVHEVGAALGHEARDKGAHVLLAPTVNLHRHPLAGRNFECHSEEPHLSARLAVASVRGVQSTGVGACVKHLVANDSEHERMTMSSEVPERVLREVYLAPFEAAVREGGAWAVMAAYNRLGGTYCSEHPWLLTTVLRGEWGFDGLVMSDWFGTHSTVEALHAGLDLEMPGPPNWRGARLREALDAGTVDREALARAARAVLVLAARTGCLDGAGAGDGEERSDDVPARRSLIRRAAVAGTVLLRNDADLLPLDPTRLGSLAVVGPNADEAQIQGGGSARVNPHAALTPVEALRARLGPALPVHHERGCVTHKRAPALDRRRLVGGRATLTYFDGNALDGPVVASDEPDRLHFTWLGGHRRASDPAAFALRIDAEVVVDESGGWTFGLTSAGRSRLLVDGEPVVDNWAYDTRSDAFFGTGSEERTAVVALEAGVPARVTVEYSAEGTYLLGGLTVGLAPPAAPDLLERAVAAAAGADACVVVVGTNDDWESEGHDRVDLALPGAQAELVRRCAAVNPRTVVVVNAGAPVAMDWAGAVPAVFQTWFGGEEAGPALAEVLVGDAEPGGRLPTTIPQRLEDTPAHTKYPGEAGRVHYGEGVFVGYRWYDARGLEPRFPFGHGLGYTTWTLDAVDLVSAPTVGAEGVTLRCAVRNTGARSGSTVVQVYVEAPPGAFARPERVLGGFARVGAEPGEVALVEVEVARRSFEVWDEAARGWTLPEGDYALAVGWSSRALPTRVPITAG